MCECVGGCCVELHDADGVFVSVCACVSIHNSWELLKALERATFDGDGRCASALAKAFHADHLSTAQMFVL